MRLLSICCLCAALGAAAAADPLASRADGSPIASGQAVSPAAGESFSIAGAPASSVTATGTVRFLEEATAGGPLLVIELDDGSVSVDLPDRGRWAGLSVRAQAVDVRVVGTLFVVERTRRGTDYVAVIRGQVKVGLRAEVARLLGQAAPADIHLRAGQSVIGGAEGFDGVQPVATVAAASAAPPAPGVAEVLSEPAISSTEVVEAVVSNVTATVIEQVRQDVTETVIQSSAPQPLGEPPGPPR